MKKININKSLLNMYELTVDDYTFWCDCHGYKYNQRDSKRDFFSLLRDSILVKKHNKLYENGVELYER